MQNSIIQKIILAVVCLLVGLTAGWLFFGSKTEDHTQEDNKSEHSHASVEEVWTCSMHPQIRQGEPGQCPICGMDLILLDEASDSEYANAVKMTDEAIRLGNIQTSKVTRGGHKKELALQGKVTVDERNVSSQVTQIGGRIERLYVSFTGESVKQGQKLAALYSPELVVAQSELLEAAKTKGTNPTLYKAARNKIRQWKFSDDWINKVEQSGVVANTVDITSDVSGVVLNKKINVGDHLRPGQPLFDVADLSKVWVQFEAYESDLVWLQQGDSISLSLPALGSQQFHSRITFIDPLVNNSTRTTAVRVELQNQHQQFKPGMFANGAVTVSSQDDVQNISIPKSAVLWTGERSIVYVAIPQANEPTFELREVSLGSDLGDRYAIAAGLEEGERVVTHGTFKVDAAAQLAGNTSMMSHKETSQVPDHSNMDHNSYANETATDQFEVAGNCVMCKNRIEEAALSIGGVHRANWNSNTKLIELHFDKSVTSTEEISAAIAASGHDTKHHSAETAVYEALPDCCVYNRIE